MKNLFFALMLIGSMTTSHRGYSEETLQGPDEYYYAIVECAAGKIIRKSGNVPVAERFTPCSTFKIPLALIGYDTGILTDEKVPLIPYDKKYSAPIESWKSDQTPESWMKNSCVWYSSRIVDLIGMETVKKYIDAFNYGNCDMSGGNPRAWLGGSLRISIDEQIAFIRKLVRKELPVSSASIAKTRKILRIEPFENGWTFYGKTGTGYNNGTPVGWFAGWIENDNSAYIIVMFLKNYKSQDTSVPAGPAAKNKCRELLLQSGLLEQNK